MSAERFVIFNMEAATCPTGRNAASRDPLANVTFRLLDRDALTDDMLGEAARLFSAHYGVWGPAAARPGRRVRLSPARLRRDYLDAPGSFLACALVHGRWVGHVLGNRFEMSDGRRGLWITQLVVDAAFRGKHVARRLISVCCDASVEVCGIVSSHPHAVRALEGATGAVVVRESVVREAGLVCRASGVPYLQEPAFRFHGGKTAIATDFYVDHRGIPRPGAGWTLGTIADGEEFVAITFPRRRDLALELARLRAALGHDRGTLWGLILRGSLGVLGWLLPA